MREATAWHAACVSGQAEPVASSADEQFSTRNRDYATRSMVRHMHVLGPMVWFPSLTCSLACRKREGACWSKLLIAIR